MDLSAYLGLFLSESRDHLANAYDLLERLEEQPADRGALRALMRHAHSLKGMGASMGYESMVSLAHAMEDEFERIGNRSESVDHDALQLLQDALSRLGDIIDRVENGQGAADPRAEELAEALRALHGATASAPLSPRPPGGELPATGDAPPDPPAVGRYRVDLALSSAISARAATTVASLTRLSRLGRIQRVSPPRLAGDPPRFEGRLSLLLDFRGDRGELTAALEHIDAIERFAIRDTPREEAATRKENGVARWVRVRADLLDAVAEGALDLLGAQRRLGEAARSGERLQERLDHAELLLEELYSAVTELRLVPFSSIADRLYQAVRELTRQLDRRVRVRIEGGDVRLDRALLDSLLDPLRHMVRNAVDHGIESPAERVAAGKPEEGTLLLQLERRGDDVSITLRDDGRGLDVDALRRAAVESGFLAPDAAARLSEAEAQRLITVPALSTARTKSDVSGRGVGMDVVGKTVERLGGRLRIRTRHGEWTRLVLELPVNQALIQALLLRCGGELFAVPVSPLRRTLALCEAGPRLRLLRLERRLGLAAAASPDSGSEGSVLVLSVHGREIGLVVDEILGRREIVVRPLRGPLERMRRYSGAAVLEEGVVALVLDPYQVCSG